MDKADYLRTKYLLFAEKLGNRTIFFINFGILSAIISSDIGSPFFQSLILELLHWTFFPSLLSPPDLTVSWCYILIFSDLSSRPLILLTIHGFYFKDYFLFLSFPSSLSFFTVFYYHVYILSLTI